MQSSNASLTFTCLPVGSVYFEKISVVVESQVRVAILPAGAAAGPCACLMSPANDNVEDVTELVFFDGHNSNQAEAAALAKVRKLDGCLRVYNGSDLTDYESGLWVQDWKSLEHHAAFQRSEIYPSFVAGVPAFAKSVAKIAHVCFHPYPADRVLRSPVTEMTIILRKPDSSAQQVDEIMKDLDNALGSWQGAVANARGVCLENDRELILVSGWNSKKDQEAFKSKNLKIFENLQEFAVLDTKLYNLKY